MNFLFYICITTSALLVLSAPSDAQEADVNAAPLTEASIQALYDESIQAYKTDVMSYKLFLTRSIHDTAVSVSESYVTIPGRGASASREKMTKADMLTSAEQNFNAMKGAVIKHNLSAVTIAPGGKTAVVKDFTKMEKINMGGIFANATGVCDDTLVATSVGPQIVISKCKADVLVELPQQK